MKKSIRKLIAMTIMTTTILGVSIIPASAEWKQDNTGYWYADGNSWATGWKQINNKWYYFNDNGYMKADSWLTYNGQSYYLKPDGSMCQNETYKGCNFENSGVWNQNYNVNSNNTTTNTANNTTNSSVNNTATANSNNSSNSNVSNTFDASTNNSGNTTLNNTGNITYNNNSKNTNNVNVTVDNTSKEEKKYYNNQNSAMKTYYEEQLKESKDALSEAKTDLERMKGQNTVQTYKKNKDGVWDFVYVPDQSKIDSAEQKVKRAENNVEYYEKLVNQYS